MKRYSYFLFDLDGTLTDSAPGVTRCVQAALEDYGIHVENADDLLCFVGPPLTDSFMNYCHCDRETAVALRDRYRLRYNVTGIFENSVIPGIPEILAALRERGAVIAVASSKPETMVRRVLDEYDLTRFFDEIAGSDPKGDRDVKADVIRDVFRRLDIQGEEQSRTLMIGDRKYDAEGARECGIDSLCAYLGYAEPGELEAAGADYVAHSAEEMGRMLLAMAEPVSPFRG